MRKVVLHFLHLSFDTLEFLIYSLRVELGDLSHRLLHQSVDVFHKDRSLEQVLVGHHCVEDFLKLVFPSLCVSLKDLVDLVLEEDLFK